jgi:hypothetical protein
VVTGQAVTGARKEKIMTEATVTLRTVVREALNLYAVDAGYVDAVESATVLAMQMGYGPLAAGTGGAYADTEVTREHGLIIADMLINTDPETGVYIGDRDEIAALAAE